MIYVKLTLLEMNWLTAKETNLGWKISVETADYGVIKPPQETLCNQNPGVIVERNADQADSDADTHSVGANRCFVSFTSLFHNNHVTM